MLTAGGEGKLEPLNRPLDSHQWQMAQCGA